MAVQTLSRLNRTCPGKDETFVLDFVNPPDDILASFQPYYRAAKLEDVTDPNIVHELMTKLGAANVYFWTEVEAFAEAFFDPKRKQSGLHIHLKPAADRFSALDEEKAEVFRKDLGTFLRMYAFLSQIVPYNDAELEKLFVFGKNLMPRIAAATFGSSILELDADVRLTHYRLQRIGEQTLDLTGSGVVALTPAGEAGTGAAPTDEQRRLAEIVEQMNDLFSGNLSEADMVGYFTTITGKLMESETLKDQAAANTAEQFALGDFKDIMTDAVIEGQQAHNAIAAQLLRDERIFGVMQSLLAQAVWQGLQPRG
jgi:type I restriction enzyme R subunit